MSDPNDAQTAGQNLPAPDEAPQTSASPTERALAAGWTRIGKDNIEWVRPEDLTDDVVSGPYVDGRWMVTPPDFWADCTIQLVWCATEDEAVDAALALWGVA